jgi:hypothetical protein
MLALLSAVATAHSPAFLWSGMRSNQNAGLWSEGDYHHEVSGAELQNAVAALASRTVAQPLVNKVPEVAPEVLTVFLHDELATDDVRTRGTSEFPVLQNLMAESPTSLEVPFTTRTGALRFDGATSVAAEQAERYLEQFPALSTNGKTDVLLIPLPANAPGKFAEHDALVGRVAAAVAKATKGNYVALLTGARSEDDVKHVTMRRQLASGDVEYGLRINAQLFAGLVVSFLLIVIFLNGFCCLFSLQTPKKFEEVKNA